MSLCQKYNPEVSLNILTEPLAMRDVLQRLPFSPKYHSHIKHIDGLV